MPDITYEQNKIQEIINTYKNEIGIKKDSNASTISYSDQQLNQIIRIENEQILKSVNLKGFQSGTENNLEDILYKYHESEIANNKSINIAVIVITFLGIAFLAVGIFGHLFGLLQNESVTLISGVVTEAIGFLIKALQTASEKSKRSYFEALNEQKRSDNVVKLVLEMREGATKNKLITKIVEEYCERTNEH